MRLLSTFLIALCIAQSAAAQEVSFEQYVSGFSSPVEIVNAGDERLFVLERRGKIRIIDGDGQVLTTPFLDIDPIVYDANFQDERGLLGIAFHPDYAANGYFYLNYIDNSSNTNIVRYSRDANDPNLADPASRLQILEIEQPYSNHNGGCIRFGPDGYLYIGMGDGGSANDPENYASNRQSMLGKMLRIDVDGGTPYAVPESNPFVGDDETLDEIWAIGLRNPWKFTFDRETGDMWIADVGQNAREEVDFEPAGHPGGRDYGWRCYEGTRFTNLDNASDCAGDYTDPVYEMAHMGFTGPCSITGGYVYRGEKYDNLFGKYICTDYCSGQIWTVEQEANGGFLGEEVTTFGNSVSTFGEGADGELYMARLSNGIIYKVLGEQEEVKYENAESVEHDPEHDRWLVSNGENIISDDGAGNIEIFGTSSAGFGLEIMGDYVFALTTTSLVCADLTTEEEIFELNIPNTSFLNGLTSNGAGILYATDFSRRQIFEINVMDVMNPSVSLLIEDTEHTPNGVLFDGINNRLLYTTWESNAKIKAVDLTTLEQSTLVSTGLGQIDGIDEDSRGNYYVSSWNPALITRYNSDFTVSETISTPPLSVPADIGYSKNLDVVGIPMGTRVIFVPVEPTSTEEPVGQALFLTVAGNPVYDICTMEITTQRSEDLTVNVWDAQGQSVRVTSMLASSGKSSYQINMTHLPAGMYTIGVVTQEGRQATTQIIKI